jgi:hypothetical protein
MGRSLQTLVGFGASTSLIEIKRYELKYYLLYDLIKGVEFEVVSGIRRTLKLSYRSEFPVILDWCSCNND